MQATVPSNIFRGVEPVTEIPSADTFDTMDTGLSEVPREKVSSKKHKRNLFKFLRRTLKKGDRNNIEKKRSALRRLIDGLSLNRRSKAAKKTAAAQRVVIMNSESVTTEEPDTPREEEGPEPVCKTPKFEASKVQSRLIEEAADFEIELEKFSEVEATTVKEEVEAIPVIEEAEPVESIAVPEDLEELANEEEVMDEIVPEKASFHINSSDYVGMVLLGVLVGLVNASRA